MVKLRRLKIEKYRNVKPGTELHFRDSLNVLLGRNGTGKTTLLNLIVQILSWDFSQLQDEVVEFEYELLIPAATVLVQVRTSLLQDSVDVVSESTRLTGDVLAMGLAQNESRYSTSIGVGVSQAGTRRGVLKIEGSRLTLEDDAAGGPPQETSLTRQVLGQNSLPNIIRAIKGFSVSPELEDVFAELRMDGLGGLRRFDESLEYLEYITREEAFWAQKVRIGSVKKSFYVAFAVDGGPGIVRRRLMQGLDSNPDADEFRIESGEEGADFLDQLVELLGCRSAQLRIQRTARSAGPNERIDFGSIRFDLTRQDGSIIGHSMLSYGQKRLLAFYYYLASSPSCVVADELVNGMHHEWIEACLEEIGERQAFLTSQNPLLLDYLYFESAAEVRSSFVLCRTELHEGREQLVWENMSLDEAEGFFSAYQVAIHHVGELLRLRGLW